MRHGNVRIPRRTSQQSKGEGTAPPSYWILRIRWKNSSSLFATTIPPRTSQWPPKYFVVECRIRSAPTSNGRCSTGAHVLSQTKIVPAPCAISASASRSTTFSNGLEGVSAQASFVFGRNAFLTAARSLMSTKSASSPQRTKISRINRDVP